MKRFLLGLLILLVISFPAFAVDPNAPDGRNVDVKHLPGIVNAVLSGAANGDTAVTVNTGLFAKQHYCTITTVAGTAPTSVTVTFYVGPDSTTQAAVATHTYTISSVLTQSFKASYPGQYIKMSYDSRAGGASNTLITAKCVSVE